MGIKICPQCSGKVSDARSDCPHCNYNFNSVKKCPDCEEQIDVSLTVCPICGHVFEVETREEATETSKTEQKENTVQVEQTSQVEDVEGLFCPYCHSANAMPIGNDLYMCSVCKGRFLDTRGLPTPKITAANTAMADSSTTTLSKADNDSNRSSGATKTSIAVEDECSTGNRARSAKKINFVSLSIAFICWVAGLIFMFSVVGESSSYLSLMEICQVEGDALSILTVIFVFALGLFLAVELGFNLIGTKKDISVIVSLVTLLIGAAAVTFASCLECGDFCFFHHGRARITITLISLLGVSALCKIISFIAACLYKPTKSNNAKRIIIILSIIIILVVALSCLISFAVKTATLSNAFKIEDGVLVYLDDVVYSYGITDITIPNNVTSIGECAFDGFSHRSLKSVVIPDSVTSIESCAFYGCDSLTSVTIPDSVTSIGDFAFDNCDSLTIYCAVTEEPSGWSSNWNYSNRPVVWGYTGRNGVSEDGFVWGSTANGIVIAGYRGVGTNITIPTAINGLSVVSIGYRAFSGCTSLTSVSIPDSVTSIGEDAFSYCDSLTSVTIPGSVDSIGNFAFYGCTSLTSVTIPDSVTSIGWAAFRNCPSLMSVVIPDSVTSIGVWAFADCASLTSVYIGNGVTSIGDGVFSDCYMLTEVTIPDSVTSIGEYAFRDCTSLMSVVIPDSVTSIGDAAFAGCSRLTSVYYPGTISDWDSISIDSSNTSLTNATRYYYSETVPTDAGNYWHYDENGNIVVW